jgi:hypothetical protein
MTVRLSKELRSTKQELAQREMRLRLQIDTSHVGYIVGRRVCIFALLISTQKPTNVSDIANGLDRSQICAEFCFISVLEVLLISSFAPRTNKIAKFVFLISAAAAGILVKTAYDSHWLWKRAKENRELANAQLRTEID